MGSEMSLFVGPLRSVSLAGSSLKNSSGARLATLEKENEDLKLALQNQDKELASQSSRLDDLTRTLAEAKSQIRSYPLLRFSTWQPVNHDASTEPRPVHILLV